MKTRFMAILTVAALVGSTGAVLASTTTGSPSETDPFCERTRNGAPANYPGIGWYPELIRADSSVGPATVMVCEGEHWDGQDSVQPQYANDPDETCTNQAVDVNQDSYNLAYNQCADPGDNPQFDVFNPIGVRYSAQGDKEALNHGSAYLFLRINGVGEVGTFAGGCHKLLGATTMYGFFNGEQGCQGNQAGHGALGVYLQDDTPFSLNLLASVVSALRLTKGYVSDGDCSQATYDQSAQNVAANPPRPPTCGRDNTAITIELLV